jgi:hypothetical protein
MAGFFRYTRVALLLFAIVQLAGAKAGAASVTPATTLHLKVPNKSSPLTLSVISWNMAEKPPTAADCSFLKRYRTSDIVVFGLQECEDIRPRRREGHRTRLWRQLQRQALGKTFQCVGSHKMGGLFISAFVRKPLASRVQQVQLVEVACGVGNMMTNKGAACIVLHLQNKSIALINSHLAAHQRYVRQMPHSIVCEIERGTNVSVCWNR